jgi:non-specific serine/threonine protein kinase
MGVVYAARDLRLRRRVAIKFLSPELCANADAVERFRREARAASSLNDPHICTVHDVGQTSLPDGSVRHFLVMELLEGRTLKEALATKRLNVDEAFDFASQILAGLEAAHAQRIGWHRLRSASPSGCTS